MMLIHIKLLFTNEYGINSIQMKLLLEHNPGNYDPRITFIHVLNEQETILITLSTLMDCNLKCQEKT